MADLALRDYQTEAIQKIDAAIARGIRRPLVALPTGTGKTVVFSHWIKDRPGKTLIMAHRDELLDQAARTIADVSGKWVGKVKAELNESLAPVVVASVQTISRPNRLRQLPDFSTIIVDEAHHTAADSYRAVLEHLGAFSPEGPVVLGVTATPQRGDGIGLHEIFDEVVYSRDIIEMIAAGWLCDLRAKRVRIKLDLDKVRTSHGDFMASSLGEHMADVGAPSQIAEAYKQEAPNRRGLIFTPTVAIAVSIAEELRAVGITAEHLSGETPTDERRAILSRLKSGETQVVPNCAVLTEGFDEPSISCIVVARPTKSQTLYVQMIGRGTRKHPGKENCLILDLMGVTERNDVVSIPTLFGLPLDQMQRSTPTGRPEIDVLEALSELEKSGQPLRFEGRIIAIDVELIRASKSAWVDGGNSYALSVGSKGIITIQPRAIEGGFQMVLNGKDGSREILHTGPDLQGEMAWAEIWAKGEIGGARSLVDREASWRNGPISDPQRSLMRRLKIPETQGMTKGQASDAISAAKARNLATGLGRTHLDDLATPKQHWRLRQMGIPFNARTLTKREAGKLIDRAFPRPDGRQ